MSFAVSKSIHVDRLAIHAGSVQSGLVHHVGEVGAGEARCSASQHAKIDVLGERNLLGVNAKNFFAATDIGTPDNDAAIEAARAQKRGIENVGTVGRGHQDDAVVGFEAVHLDEQLVQGLLALIVSAAETGAAMATDRVDFVDEDDAGSVLLALLEEVANAACANADEHLHEVRAGDGEEGHVGFAGNCAGEQRLAGSRRSDEQDALGNAAAELLELLRLAKELDDLLQLFLGFVDAGHILERDFLLLHGEQARAALAERQRLVSAALHLAEHEEPQQAENKDRRELDKDIYPAIPGGVLDGRVDLVVLENLVHVRVVCRDGGVELLFGIVLVVTVDFTVNHSDVVYLSCLGLGEELRERHFFVFTHASVLLDDAPEQHQTGQNDDPEDNRLDR